MNLFLHSLNQIFKLRLANLLKFLSLSFGILIGGLIMCRRAFLESYDKFYPNTENTYFLILDFQVSGKNIGPQRQAMAPMAPMMMEQIPEIEKATRFQYGKAEFMVDEKPIEMLTIWADSLLFDVLDFGVISGDPHTILSSNDKVLVSESAAVRMFPDGDSFGKIVKIGGQEYTIEGVFRDVPANSHLGNSDIIVGGQFRPSLAGGDSYFTYFTIVPTTSREEIIAKIKDLFEPLYEKNKADWGFTLDFSAENISKVYKFENAKDPSDLIFFFLGLLIIIVAGFNFALLEIGSLVSRAREMGVHKAYGASSGKVFMLVMRETAIYILFASIFAIILLFALRGDLEGIMGRYEDIFSIRYLWAFAAVLASIVVIAGLLPAFLFARVPVMEVFRKFTGNNLWWKQLLLYVQFAVAVFAICTLVTVALQYNKVMNAYLGYDYENLGVVDLRGKATLNNTLKNELSALPFVKGVTIASGSLLDGHTGMVIGDRKGGSISTRYMWVDKDFFQTYSIPVYQGSVENMVGGGVVINRTLQQLINLSLDDQDLTIDRGTTVVALCGDTRTNLFSEQPAMIFTEIGEGWNGVTLTYRTIPNITQAQQRRIQQIIDTVYPDSNFQAQSYRSLIYNFYSKIRDVRDGVLVGAFILLAITLMGVVGYLTTDIRRRSREIAIRRTHGASGVSIIVLVCKRIFIVALISAATAIVASYFANKIILSFFADQITQWWWIFAIGAATIILIIILSTFLQTYKIAHKDYVKIIGRE